MIATATTIFDKSFQKPVMVSNKQIFIFFTTTAITLCKGLIGSQLADPQKYPFLVSIEFQSFYADPLCGVLITTSWILSTGQLEQQLIMDSRHKKNKTVVRAGFHGDNLTQQIRFPKLWSETPRSLDEHFVSVMKVDKPFQETIFVKPAKLPKNLVERCSRICDKPLLVGLGVYDLNGAANETEADKRIDKLKFGEVELLEGKTLCDKLLKKISNDSVFSSTICSNSRPGPTYKDDGAPLICEDDTVVGITLRSFLYVNESDVITSLGLYMPVCSNLEYIQRQMEKFDNQKEAMAIKN